MQLHLLDRPPRVAARTPPVRFQMDGAPDLEACPGTVCTVFAVLLFKWSTDLPRSRSNVIYVTLAICVALLMVFLRRDRKLTLLVALWYARP